MLEAQQRNLLAHPERKLLKLNIDAGGVRATHPGPADRARTGPGPGLRAAGSGMMRVRIADKTDAADGIAVFELVAADGGTLPPFSAGAHVDVHPGNGLVRQYSLCNDPAETHRYLLGVLRDPASRGGSAAMHALAAGDTLEISAPKNHFPCTPTPGIRCWWRAVSASRRSGDGAEPRARRRLLRVPLLHPQRGAHRVPRAACGRRPARVHAPVSRRRAGRQADLLACWPRRAPMRISTSAARPASWPPCSTPRARPGGLRPGCIVSTAAPEAPAAPAAPFR